MKRLPLQNNPEEEETEPNERDSREEILLAAMINQTTSPSLIFFVTVSVYT